MPNGYVWQTLNDSPTEPEKGTPVYGGMAGTSMAAPHVSATVALLQSIAPRPLTPAEVEARLKQTARAFPVAIPASTPMGVGLLNAKAVVAKKENSGLKSKETLCVSLGPSTGLFMR